MIGTRMLAACAVAALGFCATSFFATDASAQTYPNKPIKLVLGFPPGPLDIVARPVAQKLGEALGQPVVIENRPGANGAIASEQVSRGEADGYTILLGTSGTHVTAVHLVKSLPYDPVKDFAPIIAAVEPITCLAVNPSVPAKNAAELVTWIKANSGKVSYGTPGVGSVFHLAGELFKQTTGVEMTQVPYRGLEPAMMDVIAGHIPMLLTSCSTVAPHAKADKARILAILEPQRFSGMPDVPSITETIPAFKKPSTWFGFFAPPATPQPIIAKLNSEIGKILAQPDMKQRFADSYYTAIGGTPDEFRALMVDGINRFGDIIKTAGIKPE